MINEIPSIDYFLRMIIRPVFLLLLSCIALPACKPEQEEIPADEGKIIVLMYHRIVEDTPENLYERSLRDLESDIKYLITNNITIIDFNDLGSVLTGNKKSYGNSAIITFDDGDCSWYSLVRPLLERYRIKATFFLWTDMIGKDSFISWEEVENMSHYAISPGIRPFTFGSHSCSHPFLHQSRDSFSTNEDYNSFLDYELGASRQIIEKHTPGSVQVFALPYGDGAGDSDIIDAAIRNGYEFIRTSIWGTIDTPSTDPFLIPCLPMLDSTDPELIGAYLGL
ncbi:MAG TPA: polysaccharide deacetylase family protein [Bacteroidales bacterium]|nr:polysaccharide deacetylase family protein [Bacteroidales bacterium]HNR42612.1 polysaccharide deacetylase family protein [Bacteroidales bacterium]HPM18514.1 polysaccharide deacetylase family protein [Bacteroidales bacterium]HQG78250.1 polysaccharide deacetylase family protein [Bacteroidales bacterium]